jgi:hypothetical protein
MKNVLFLLVSVSLLATACRSLTSVTTIKANESFVLGNNPHRGYSVELENTAKYDLTIIQSDLDGVVKSTMVAQPKKKITLKIAPNTVLRIENKANKSADVALKVVGDTGLSMGYQNQMP